MQTVEQKVLTLIRRGVIRRGLKRPVSLVRLAHYYADNWPRLRRALVQLETEGKIVVGVVPLPERGMYVHVFPAKKVPENVRIYSMKRRI